MNLNKGCIEILLRCQLVQRNIVMNLNKGCIEIEQPGGRTVLKGDEP